jgi:hypothetical protein
MGLMPAWRGDGGERRKPAGAIFALKAICLMPGTRRAGSTPTRAW